MSLVLFLWTFFGTLLVLLGLGHYMRTTQRSERTKGARFVLLGLFLPIAGPILIGYVAYKGLLELPDFLKAALGK